MRAKTLTLAVVAFAGFSCGGGVTGPGMVSEADQRSSDMRAAESAGEVCTTDCAGKMCGPDGCGGTCGVCGGPAETCSDGGQCQPFTCKTSKECPGELVCAPELGECVECVGDEDCGGETTCGADHVCHEVVACKSDKDCKEYGLLCDKVAGLCVECMESKDCLPEEYCLDSYCLKDVCDPGESRCDGQDVLTCEEDGSVEGFVQTCLEGTYCEDATCKPYLCDAGKTWCDGDVLKVCAADGKSVESEADCAADEMICFDEKCQACACKPGSTTCVDDSTVALCSDNCLEWVDSPCGAGESCLEGKCQSWLCQPGAAFCAGDVAKVCGGNGLSVVSEENCAAGQDICLEGKCESFVCAPSSTTCLDPGTLKHCSQDGMSFEPEPCASSYCKDGQCVPYACQPGAALCDGSVATHCDAWGSGLEPGGTDCAEAQSCCVGGQCVEVGPEICDGKDNDCDGEVDEGALSPCGDCNPACQQSTTGPDGDEPFDILGENGYGVDLDGDGFLVTDLGKVIPANLWVANSGENTVSRVDTEQCKETGRYAVCSNPSRTAVDLKGSVWVGCRNDGAVAKIAIDTALCPDKNGNGIVDTAADLNGDGKITGAEVLPKGTDECVLFMANPGGSCQRALGVDRYNHAWVGEWYGMVLRRLHPDTGAVVKQHTLSVNPYGLVIDGKGTIWVSGRGGNKLVEVDPESGQVGTYTSSLGCFEPYGIALDGKGRIWIANCCCWNVAYRFSPETKTWAAAQTKDRPRGLAGSLSGKVYVANDTSDHIAVVDAESAIALAYVHLGGGRFPIGIAMDPGGFVWAVNQSANSAIKMDPELNKTVCEVKVGSGPYTYSDMTGYVLHNFTAPDLNPFFIHKFATTGGAVATWLSVKIEAASNGACNSMSVLARPVPDGAPLPWIPVAENVPIETAEFPLAALPSGIKAVEVKLVLPYQSNGCSFTVKGLTATFAAP